MNKAIFLALTAAIATTSTSATAKNSDDSVTTWGPWSSVATAAGPQGRINPFAIRFSETNNLTDSDQFVTAVQTAENDDYRFYGAAMKDNYEGRGDNRVFRQLSNLEILANPDANESGRIVMTKTDGNLWQLSQWHDMHTKSTPDGSYSTGYLSKRVTEKGWFNITNEDGLTVTLADIYKPNNNRYFYGTTISGTVSSLNAIQSLASEVTGTLRYSGGFLNSGANVHWIKVNFDASTWSGKFGTAGVGLGKLKVADAPINGADLSAGLEHMTASKAALKTGSINASFFGSQADIIAGVMDVKGKTKDGNRRFTDVFTACTEGCSINTDD